MIRRGFALLLLLFPGVLAAQDGTAPTAPVLRQDMELTEAVPGQALTLRLSVLVPSYMPQPPVWPSFDTPDVMVRVPERGTGPTTQQVDGESWSGVSRRYDITPLAPGDFVLAPAEVIVTWADPDTNETRKDTVTLDEIRFSGVVPEAATGLDPFLAAQELSLDQKIDGDPSALAPGDSVTVTITASVTGASPLAIPPLLALPTIEGVAAYPDEPRVTETADGGNRSEAVTLVAEHGSDGTLPAIELGWYNLDKDSLETAVLDPVAIHVEGSPPGVRLSGAFMRRALLVLVLCAMLVGLGLRACRHLRPLWHRHAARRRQSESRARQALQEIVRQRDFPALHPALDLWASRLGGPDPRRDPRVITALETIGAARYGQHGSQDDGWLALAAALAAVRRDRETFRQPAALPPLNPTS